MIDKNLEAAKLKYDGEIPISEHPAIRSVDACYKSSSKAMSLAKKHGSKLHVLHLTTAKEMELFETEIIRRILRLKSASIIFTSMTVLMINWVVGWFVIQQLRQEQTR